MPEPPAETPGAILADLSRAFPRQPVDRETFAVYIRELADVTSGDLRGAVRELIRTSEFFPTVRAIRATVIARALALPSAAEALAQVEQRIAWARLPDDRRGDAPDVHPLARWTLDRVGGYPALRDSDEPGIVRATFLKLYREARDEELRRGQVGGVLDAVPPLRALDPAA